MVPNDAETYIYIRYTDSYEDINLLRACSYLSSLPKQASCGGDAPSSCRISDLQMLSWSGRDPREAQYPANDGLDHGCTNAARSWAISASPRCYLLAPLFPIFPAVSAASRWCNVYTHEGQDIACVAEMVVASSRRRHDPLGNEHMLAGMACILNHMHRLQNALHYRKFEFGPGSIMGTTDFFLKRHRSYSITCTSPTQVYRLSRSALPQLSASDPQVGSRMSCFQCSWPAQG